MPRYAFVIPVSRAYEGRATGNGKFMWYQQPQSDDNLSLYIDAPDIVSAETKLKQCILICSKMFGDVGSGTNKASKD